MFVLVDNVVHKSRYGIERRFRGARQAANARYPYNCRGFSYPEPGARLIIATNSGRPDCSEQIAQPGDSP